MRPNPLGRFEWRRRRRLIYATLIYCAVSATAVMIAALYGANSTLLNTIVVSAYSLAGGVLGSYVFGAVWDDRNARVYGDNYADPTGDPEIPMNGGGA